MATPVLNAYLEHSGRVNRENSFFARRDYWPMALGILEQTGALLGVERGELAFTRNASEALQNLIGGYNLLKAGDAVMYADLDYDSMMSAMKVVGTRAGADVIELKIPEPTSYDGLIEFYRLAFKKHKNTKLLLLTHISHRTGLVMPVKEIVGLARQQGIDVIVDAAHSWGQIDFKVDDLGADFIGFNLHKWIGAPIGVGAMYIRRQRLADINPVILADPSQYKSIQGRVHTGTMNYAAIMTVPDALKFRGQIGWQAIEQRLVYLRQQWAQLCLNHKSIEILTPEDSRLYRGITSFRIKGMVSKQDNQKLAGMLLKQYGLFSVYRGGVNNGACVRVTPGLYNGKRDMEKLGKAVVEIANELTLS